MDKQTREAINDIQEHLNTLSKYTLNKSIELICRVRSLDKRISEYVQYMTEDTAWYMQEPRKERYRWDEGDGLWWSDGNGGDENPRILFTSEWYVPERCTSLRKERYRWDDIEDEWYNHSNGDLDA